MKIVMAVSAVLSFLEVSVFAQTGAGQGGGMMEGGRGWGMNFGGFYMIIITILLVLGVAFMMNRKK